MTDLEPAPLACPICTVGRPWDVIAVLDHVWVTAPLEAPLPGYVCVVSRVHVREAFELADDNRAGFWRDLHAVAVALDRALRPKKLNYEIHGNTNEHLHVHVYPRIAGDPFEGRPIDPREMVPRSESDIARLRDALAAANGVRS
jgi:diadenosine tetraphosphate (Ap4A) HIT family hydrolase